MKHTPGPWSRGYGNHIFQGARDHGYPSGRLLAICEPSSRTEADWEQVFANANLIAAAPEMLDALKDMVEYMVLAGYDDNDDTARLPGAVTRIAAAKAIIKKAES
jgi:hypothetical protein